MSKKDKKFSKNLCELDTFHRGTPNLWKKNCPFEKRPNTKEVVGDKVYENRPGTFDECDKCPHCIKVTFEGLRAQEIKRKN